MAAVTPVLAARGLRVTGPSGALVDGVDLDLEATTVTALVGESGAGKSLTGLALLGLVPGPARLEAGEVVLEGRLVSGLPPRGARAVRGARIALVPQDPAAALDPVIRVGAQVAEILRVHRGLGRADAREAAARALAEVGVTRDDHPHRLSGGQRQRALIAMALAPGPAVLIADEPTASLDPSVQVGVLDLIGARREAGLAVLLISHDLGSVARLAGRVAVMYAGRIVEEGPARAVLSAPRHPYTAGLLALAPRMSGPVAARAPMPGSPPAAGEAPAGCAFAPRCAARRDACAAPQPRRAAGPARRVACLLDESEAAALRGGTG